MTRLLVSVRNTQEAQAALHGGAAVIDVKEPRRGSLGRVAAQTVCNIGRRVGQRAQLSAAIGEIIQPPPKEFFASLTGYKFAKFGLADAIHLPCWESQWWELVEQLPAGTSPVAVIYADWQRCGAPSPEAVVKVACDRRCPVLLVDTCIKDGRNLLSYLSLHQIEQLIEQIHSCKLCIALAGGIDTHALDALAPLKPDLIAVRSAVCRGSREGHLIEARVRELAQRLHLELPAA